MRRRHPWWAMLAATALVVASLLAPMEGAAKRVAPGGDPVDRGDPDNPSEGKSQPDVVQGNPSTFLVTVLQPMPGVFIQIRIPARLHRVTAARGRSPR